MKKILTFFTICFMLSCGVINLNTKSMQLDKAIYTFNCFNIEFSSMDKFIHYLDSQESDEIVEAVYTIYEKKRFLGQDSFDKQVIAKFSSENSITYIYDFNLYKFKDTIFSNFNKRFILADKENVNPQSQYSFIQDICSII